MGLENMATTLATEAALSADTAVPHTEVTSVRPSEQLSPVLAGRFHPGSARIGSLSHLNGDRKWRC